MNIPWMTNPTPKLKTIMMHLLIFMIIFNTLLLLIHVKTWTVSNVNKYLDCTPQFINCITANTVCLRITIYLLNMVPALHHKGSQFLQLLKVAYVHDSLEFTNSVCIHKKNSVKIQLSIALQFMQSDYTSLHLTGVHIYFIIVSFGCTK